AHSQSGKGRKSVDAPHRQDCGVPLGALTLTDVALVGVCMLLLLTEENYAERRTTTEETSYIPTPAAGGNIFPAAV
ncbi:MAG: hypothetical protein AB7N65_31640, partial [Vicinamibacterales bacterium]